ncbi:MAG: phosphodiester glycosidase family protein [Myxococcota bacterium]
MSFRRLVFAALATTLAVGAAWAVGGPVSPDGSAAYAVLTPDGLVAPGVTVRTMRSTTVSWRVVTLDLRVATLALYGQAPGEPRSFGELDAFLRRDGKRLVVGTNAGIFETPSLPSGLFVSHGVERHGLNQRAGDGNFYWKPNGVFWVDSVGAHVAPAADWPGSAGVHLATQSGPLLAHGGVLHPGVAVARGSLNLRNAVGVTDRHTVHLAMSLAPVSLRETADLFVDHLAAPDALYLDGTISDLCVSDTCARPGGTWAGILAVVGPTEPP